MTIIQESVLFAEVTEMYSELQKIVRLSHEEVFVVLLRRMDTLFGMDNTRKNKEALLMFLKEYKDFVHQKYKDNFVQSSGDVGYYFLK